MGPRGPNGARKAQKTPENGAQMSPVDRNPGSGPESRATAVMSAVTHRFLVNQTFLNHLPPQVGAQDRIRHARRQASAPADLPPDSGRAGHG
jgi:hypothetical protein